MGMMGGVKVGVMVGVKVGMMVGTGVRVGLSVSVGIIVGTSLRCLSAHVFPGLCQCVRIKLISTKCTPNTGSKSLHKGE